MSLAIADDGRVLRNAKIPKDFEGVDKVLEQQLSCMLAEKDDAEKALKKATLELQKHTNPRDPTNRTLKAEILGYTKNLARLETAIEKQIARFQSILDGAYGAARGGIKESEDRLSKAESSLADAEKALGISASEENILAVATAKGRLEVCKALLARQRTLLGNVKEESRKDKAGQALATAEAGYPERTKKLQKRAAKYLEAIEVVKVLGEEIQKDFDNFRAEMENAGVDMPGSLFLQLDSPLKWLGILIARDWSEPTVAMYQQEKAYIQNACHELDGMIQNRIKKAWKELERKEAKRALFQVALDGSVLGLHPDGYFWSDRPEPDGKSDRIIPIVPGVVKG